MNSSSATPLNPNISRRSNLNSDVTSPFNTEQPTQSTHRDIHATINSRRRINMQTAPTNFATHSSSTSLDNDNENDFERIIEEFERLDLEDADGGNSDTEGAEAEGFDEAFVKSMIDRNSEEGGIHIEEINSGEIAFVLAEDKVLDGCDNIDFLDKVTKVPDDWVIPEKKAGDDEPEFDKVDNPGNWNNFVFRPLYKKIANATKTTSAKYSYVRHELPTGCTPVPLDKDGKRIYKGWEFFYKGWKSRKFPNARDGATPDDLFPESRSSSLDLDVLLKLGLNEERMAGVDRLPDALFFFQLLLPMCDPTQSGVLSDPRKGYYHKVTRFSNLYKYQAGIGTTYGHDIPEVKLQELVRWDGCVIRDGVRGGGDGALYRRWQYDSASFDSVIDDSMSMSRWNQIKRIFKLNNNDTARKRGEEGYDPAYKYDMIYDTLVSNVIAVTKFGELDLTGDETSWPFQGYGEMGAKLVYKFVKPGISKGGQTAIVSATNRIRPYWYQHRHRHNNRFGPGFTAEGPAEVRACIDSLEKHVIGREGDFGEKKIFKKCPHITWDNYFSGEEVCKYAGEKGFGLLMTNRRDRLPAGVKSEYMHKKRTEATKRSKCARFIEPVILVKDYDSYEIVLTSFQSTSSCNIISVNSMSQNKNFIEARSRGRKDKKRVYVIEQNQARRMYLKSYSRIDSIDHLIKNCNLKYRSWKYWHSAANHAKALAITVTYDMYLEVAEGKLQPSLKVSDPVDFFTFRDILSKQMCSYDPKNQKYAGDEKMRIVSKMTNKMRQKRKSSDTVKAPSDGSGNLTFDQYCDLLRSRRVCNDLCRYENHLNCITPHKSPAKCAVCGEMAYKRCNICNAALHNMDTKGIGKGRNCALQWHNEAYLGLCFEDRKLLGVTAKNWKMWSGHKAKENARRIKGYSNALKRKR